MVPIALRLIPHSCVVIPGCCHDRIFQPTFIPKVKNEISQRVSRILISLQKHFHVSVIRTLKIDGLWQLTDIYFWNLFSVRNLKRRMIGRRKHHDKHRPSGSLCLFQQIFSELKHPLISDSPRAFLGVRKFFSDGGLTIDLFESIKLKCVVDLSPWFWAPCKKDGSVTSLFKSTDLGEWELLSAVDTLRNGADRCVEKKSFQRRKSSVFDTDTFTKDNSVFHSSF